MRTGGFFFFWAFFFLSFVLTFGLLLYNSCLHLFAFLGVFCYYNIFYAFYLSIKEKKNQRMHGWSSTWKRWVESKVSFFT